MGNPAPVVNGKKEDAPFTVDFNVEERTTDGGEEIYQVCEIAPEYPGGLAELMRWLRMNVKYPKAARDINGQGKVFVRFVVMADGSISNAEVVKSDFTSDYSEVSLAEQTVKEIEYYKNSIERIENDCKELEQHIEEWKNKLAVLEKDGTSENILNRRREELEKAQKLLEDERATIVIMKRTLAQKEELLAFWQTPTITPVAMSALAAVCWMLKNRDLGRKSRTYSNKPWTATGNGLSSALTER